MPSPRRIRLLFYVVLAGVVTMLFFTAQQRQSRPADTRTLRDFYGKTMGAMDKARGASGGGAGQAVMDKATGDVDGDGDIDEDDERLARETSERLRAAEQKAKELANAKGPNRPDPPSDVIGVGSSAEGQVKKVGGGADGAGEEVVESEEEHEVEVVLNGILKKAPGTVPRSVTNLVCFCFAVLISLQSSSSQSRIALTQRGQKASSSRNTSSTRRRSWWNSTRTRWGGRYKTDSGRRRVGRRCPTS